MAAFAASWVACTTGTSDFQVKERTERTSMGQAQLIDLYFQVDDSPGAKIVRSQQLFWDFVDGFATAIANPNNPYRFCINAGPSASAYIGGIDGVDDSKRILGNPVCNFSETGGPGGSELELRDALRRKFSPESSGPTGQQMIGGFFRILEWNDPFSKAAPFPRGPNGQLPAAYIVAFLTVSADVTPTETPIAGTFPVRYEKHPMAKAPLLQAGLWHQIHDNGAPSSLFHDSGRALVNILGKFSVGDFSSTVCTQEQLQDPAELPYCCTEADILLPEIGKCVCGMYNDPVTSIQHYMCHPWLYRPNYPLMPLNEAKQRMMTYFQGISGSSAPKVVLASMGNQDWNTVLGAMGVIGYLTNLNTRINRLVNSFNADFSPEAEAYCSANNGLDGKCNWGFAATNASGGIFALAEDLAANSLTPIVLKAKPDLSKPFRVIVDAAGSTRDLTLGTDFTVSGNTVTVIGAARTQLLSEMVNAQPTVEVKYFPLRSAL